MWDTILKRTKAAGINLVQTYAFWYQFIALSLLPGTRVIIALVLGTFILYKYIDRLFFFFLKGSA